jgi:pteridine reductase
VNKVGGKAALVTGAARRIGAEITGFLHARGWNVVMHCHQSHEAAQALADKLNLLREDSVRLISADLSDTGGLQAVIDQAGGFWGRLDGLVNNASVFSPTPLGSLDRADWQRVMQPNLEAPFFLSQAAWPLLRTTRGAIVNVTDIYADHPLKSHPIYSISKAGLVALTRSLALEMAPEVRVNAVSPGAILWPENQTDLGACEKILEKVPMERSGVPEDIAKTVHFLLEEAPYVTGQVIAVDGGRTLAV